MDMQSWLRPISSIKLVSMFVLVASVPTLALSRDMPACDPVVPKIHLPMATQSLDGEAAAKQIFEDDQRDRNEPEADFKKHWAAISKRDTEQRKQVLTKLEKNELRSAWELFVAALVFQHGACPDHYLLANTLAKAAIERGSKPAKQLYAATMDRYLESVGKLQKYGTQYRYVGNETVLRPVDPATTDAERAKYNVPPLAEARKGMK